MKPLGHTSEVYRVDETPNNDLSNSRKDYFTTKYLIIPERDT